ncbi:helix-turn-helix domain-containing protein [Kitasatospora sp. NPDC004745]|uniref:helix-turn-helix domain-containing protein n=1 Tax=Kitasatospora sp. NPDC004745 TaxID=3364019 RepID=UPI0036A0816D
MASVVEWTGVEARALRVASRRSVRVFAAELGVAVRTVTNWERLGAGTRPRPDTQAILDTALSRLDLAGVLRFEAALAQRGRALAAPASGGPRLWEYETWSDDIERAVAAASQQDFMAASNLLERWRTRWPVKELDDRGLYLFARTTALAGDLQRDRGVLLGPWSASRSYADARSVFGQLGIPRRIAQLDLSLAVVAEMSGDLHCAASRYEKLSCDGRLSGRDQLRAHLWVGTALDKQGLHSAAMPLMASAIRGFEAADEQEDWATAHQKLALAHRGAGELGEATRLISVAQSAGGGTSPLHQVRLATAHGHVLLSDRATVDEGLAVLDRAAATAATYGMSHQLRSIESIRKGVELGGGAVKFR